MQILRHVAVSSILSRSDFGESELTATFRVCYNYCRS